MKKINYLIFLSAISVFINILLLIDRSEALQVISRSKESYNLPIAQSASCSFKSDISTIYHDDKKEIIYSLNHNKEPINISFVNLDAQIPTMRGNAGQDNLLKVVDNDDIVTMIEEGPVGFGTLQSFSIFKKTGVGIWTKQYNLIGKPFGLISMGYCD